MKPPRVKTADCSHDTLIRISKRCGFIVVAGRKHCKIKTRDGRFVTVVPRHNRLKRETAKGILEALNEYGANVVYG